MALLGASAFPPKHPSPRQVLEGLSPCLSFPMAEWWDTCPGAQWELVFPRLNLEEWQSRWQAELGVSVCVFGGVSRLPAGEPTGVCRDAGVPRDRAWPQVQHGVGGLAAGEGSGLFALG